MSNATITTITAERDRFIARGLKAPTVEIKGSPYGFPVDGYRDILRACLHCQYPEPGAVSDEPPVGFWDGYWTAEDERTGKTYKARWHDFSHEALEFWVIVYVDKGTYCGVAKDRGAYLIARGELREEAVNFYRESYSYHHI